MSKKIVYVKNVPLGDGNIVIQSMTNTLTTDIDGTVQQILRLKEAGAELVRVSIPDEESAKAIKHFVNLGVPIIGDIHFSEKPALIAIENGIAKIRLNPGNMTKEGIKNTVKACIERNIPIRVGVNKGSSGNLSPKELADKCIDTAKIIEDLGWDKLVLAVKSSDVKETVEAYRYLSSITDYPLHVGLTEAGTINSGFCKSAIAIGSLLLEGIGDTIRVSLATDPIEEIYAAKRILRAAGIDKKFVEVIACPTCARTNIEVSKLAEEIEKYTEKMTFPLKIAIMGCVVNGIGESKGADFGVAGGKDISAIFRDKEILKKVPNEKIYEDLLQIIEEYRLKNE